MGSITASCGHDITRKPSYAVVYEEAGQVYAVYCKECTIRLIMDDNLVKAERSGL